MGLPADLLVEAEGFSDCLVYPDCWPSVALFMDMNTQWRIGFGGPTGLDYTALSTVMKFRGIKDDEACDVFSDIQVMESAALELFQSRKE